MSKMRHINLHNLIYLSGLREDLAIPLARVLDNLLENLMSGDNPKHEQFIKWRKRATFALFTQEDMNFSFRAYQWPTPEGKTATLCGIDHTTTKGEIGNARRGAYVYCYLATPEGQEIVSFPLVYILREHGPIKGQYVVYEHGAVDYTVTGHELIKSWAEAGVARKNASHISAPKEPHGANGLIYIGITSRAWTIRYKEHLSKATNGSLLPFHSALRNKFGLYNTRFHYVLCVVKDKDSAEDFEEKAVEIRSLYPKGLNAIPGGKAGIRYLASINALRPRKDPSPEILEDDLADALTDEAMVKSNPIFTSLSRLPNKHAVGERPEMSSFWNNDDNAARMITSRSDRLSIEQIRNARYAASMGLTPTEIQASIGAKSVDVVRRLLDGRTYTRVNT